MIVTPMIHDMTHETFELFQVENFDIQLINPKDMEELTGGTATEICGYVPGSNKYVMYITQKDEYDPKDIHKIASAIYNAIHNQPVQIPMEEDEAFVAGFLAVKKFTHFDMLEDHFARQDDQKAYEHYKSLLAKIEKKYILKEENEDEKSGPYFCNCCIHHCVLTSPICQTGRSIKRRMQEKGLL